MLVFLEKILLDESGNIRPQYNDTAEDTNGFSEPSAENKIEATIPIGGQHVSADDSYYRQPGELSRDRFEVQERAPSGANPLKRKLSQVQTWNGPIDLEAADITQYLPEQAVLCKVADFFCVSFHHWIPYLHKQRLQTRVRQELQRDGFVLVLHALVAVVLRHMDPHTLFLDVDEIERQSRISRSIVESQSLRSVTVESLQALIFIVFDHVNAPSQHHVTTQIVV